MKEQSSRLTPEVLSAIAERYDTDRLVVSMNRPGFGGGPNS